MIYIVDTNVFLSDPKALQRLEGKQIVIPLVVLTELESKRNHPELGYQARCALRQLEQIRKDTGSLTEACTNSAGGSVRVELNHIEDSDLPKILKTAEADNRILAVASNLASEGNQVTLLTKDLPLRLKAAVAGIEAQDYNIDEQVDADWGGIVNLQIQNESMDDFEDYGSIYLEESEQYPINTGIILRTADRRSAIGRINRAGEIQDITSKKLFDLEPRNAEQAISMDLLADDNVGIVSLGGLAGSGKTVMALAAGLDGVIRRRKYDRVIVFRPIYSVGGQELGFLPGTAEEKMAPWTAAVTDAMESFMKKNIIADAQRMRQIEVLPLTHIRGRTLSNSYVIIDEAQNLDLMVLVTALSRMGRGSKVVLTHDVNQRDNLRVGKYDGIARVISTLSDSDLFAHVSLVKSERSPIAELVSSSFDL